VKSEELFIVYRHVAALLEERGLTIVDPQVGEFCTSFDMAGASLTLLWLDDELERLWTAPADTPALTRGSVGDASLVPSPDPTTSGPGAVPESSPESRDAARRLTSILETIVVTAERDNVEWGHLDSVAGDGDHGIGMQRGARAALAAAETATTAGAGARTVLTSAASAWADRAGGTSGALWGVLLRSLAGELSDTASPDASQLAVGVSRGREAVMAVGKASVGDKTMVDALVPFDDTLTAEVSAGAGIAAAWRVAAEAATRGAESTAALAPRLGRARTHGDKAVGSPDPGAVSFAAIARAVAEHLDHRLEDDTAGER
jgi:dihydroxyacetone kinase